MIEPLKAGDVCQVVGGLGRGKSPNVGQTVTIVRRMFGYHGADHSEHGPIYRCKGDEIYQLTDAGTYQKTEWADFAGKWLRRIDPPVTLKTTEREATA